MLPVI